VHSAVKTAVAPAYLLACLLLGGSAQGIWQNMLLQLAGVAIIAWAAATGDEPLPKAAQTLLLILVAGLVVIALQLIPLPASLWTTGLRARVGEGYAILGQAIPPLPISLTPYAGLNTLLGIVPALAVFCAVLRLGAFRASWLAAALLAGTVVGITLGALQVVAPGPNSPWYLYPQTNRGVAVGFFANANHMADLLVCALPFIAALASAGRSRNIQRYSALLVVLAAAALLIVVGIALNGSLAGYVLALPVIGASILIAAPPRRSLRTPVAILTGLALVAAVGAIASTSIGSSRIGQEASGSVQSREAILQTTAKAMADTMPFGSGLGSFVRVYPLYESADRVVPEYVIHAHNDYAELALELGVPGIALMVLFLATWLVAAKGAWRRDAWNPFAQAASIASAAVLVHSLVDFPLRTAAVSASFAMCMALMAERRVPARVDTNDLRPTRHLVIA